MAYLFQMVNLTNSIILTGSIIGSIYLYVNRTKLQCIVYNKPSIKSILKNKKPYIVTNEGVENDAVLLDSPPCLKPKNKFKNSDDKLSFKNKVPVVDEVVQIDVKDKPTLRKTRSVCNIYIETDLNMLTHFRIKDRLDNNTPNPTEMKYINEILKNTRNNSYLCSNPDCRDYISRKGAIYNAFDVKFCSEECRNKVRNVVQQYWNY